MSFPDNSKICISCHRSLPLLSFHKHKNKRFGLSNRCRSCTAEFDKSRRDSRRNLLPSAERVCPTCAVLKPASCFYRNLNSRSGLFTYCKDCASRRAKAWRSIPEVKRKIQQYKRSTSSIAQQKEYQKLPETKKKNRASRLLKKYGLTSDQFDELLRQQNFRCAICESTEPSGTGIWHIDHDHQTNKVRGILCHHCNVALGSVRDSARILRRMMCYLSSRKCTSVKEEPKCQN